MCKFDTSVDQQSALMIVLEDAYIIQMSRETDKVEAS